MGTHSYLLTPAKITNPYSLVDREIRGFLIVERVEKKKKQNTQTSKGAKQAQLQISSTMNFTLKSVSSCTAVSEYTFQFGFYRMPDGVNPEKRYTSLI